MYIVRVVPPMDFPDQARRGFPSNRPPIKWPPKVVYQVGLGHLKDIGGMFLATDIGRSTMLSNGQVVFQFGDTFFRCSNVTGHSSDRTRSIGTTSNEGTRSIDTNSSDAPGCDTSRSETGHVHENCNTMLQNGLTLVPDHCHPCISIYPHGRQFSSDGKTLRALLTPFGEYDRIWSFSGVVESQYDILEDGSDSIRGYVWYEVRRFGPEFKFEDCHYANSGVAEICFNFPPLESPKHTMAASVFVLEQKELFWDYESRFGTFCSLEIGDWAYCYGHLAFPPRHCPKVSKGVGLARVPVMRANKRESYQYWNGKTWAKDIIDAEPVFTDMQHGQIFRSDMFLPEYPWAFFGCNSFGDSKAILGRGKAPEGPWQWQTLEDLMVYTKIPRPIDSFCYCFYPHPWVSELGSAELVVTWCDGGMTGNIIAERITLETA